VEQGSRVAKFGDTKESAWQIVDLIIDFEREPIDPTVFENLVGQKPKRAPSKGFFAKFKKLFS